MCHHRAGRARGLFYGHTRTERLVGTSRVPVLFPAAQVDDAGLRGTENALVPLELTGSQEAIGAPEASLSVHPAIMSDSQPRSNREFTLLSSRRCGFSRFVYALTKEKSQRIKPVTPQRRHRRGPVEDAGRFLSPTQHASLDGSPRFFQQSSHSKDHLQRSVEYFLRSHTVPASVTYIDRLLCRGSLQRSKEGRAASIESVWSYGD